MSPSNSAFRPSPFPPVVDTLGRFLVSRGIDAYLVGGAVRDALLGLSIHDIDIAVSADVESLGRNLADFLGGRFVRLHEDWGIARVVLPDAENALFIDLSRIRNSILDDLARRDFTIDAMAVPVTDTIEGNPWDAMLDPYDGVRDLERRVVRSLSPSVFIDDPARLMRVPRLAAQLGFTLEEDTARQIRRNAHIVRQVAPERVRDEFLKLMSLPGALGSVRLLDALGLLSQVIPEIDEARGVTQPKEHYWDVFNHLVETVGQVERIFANRVLNLSEGQPDGGDFVVNTVPGFESMSDYFAEEVTDGHNRLTLLKLAGLLHDIAKPATRSVEESGRIRFLGHHTEGARMAKDILRRLRFSRRGVDLMELMVHHHLRPAQMAQRGELPSGKAIYRYYRDVDGASVDTLYLNMADFLAARGPELEESAWTEHCRVIEHILREGREQKAPEMLPKLITGHDIMSVFSLNPGPHVGRLLDLVREAQANGDVQTREEALELVNTSLESGGHIAQER